MRYSTQSIYKIVELAYFYFKLPKLIITNLNFKYALETVHINEQKGKRAHAAKVNQPSIIIQKEKNKKKKQLLNQPLCLHYSNNKEALICVSDINAGDH